MQRNKITILLLAAVMPLGLLATPATDRKIEDAAKDSYNFRVVLNHRVTARAEDGIVTLNGNVEDQDTKDLAGVT